MDVNYSRWMSKDPDAEPDVVDEPSRFSLPQPSRSAVASTALISLIVLGGAAFVRSTATPEVTSGQAQAAQTPAAEQSSGPGAAGVDDSALNDSALEDSTSDSSASDDSATSDWSAPVGPPPGPPQVGRREFGPPDGGPPRPRMLERFRERRFGP